MGNRAALNVCAERCHSHTWVRAVRSLFELRGVFESLARILARCNGFISGRGSLANRRDDFLYGKVRGECRVRVGKPGRRMKTLLVATKLLDVAELPNDDLAQRYRALD